MMSVVGRRSFWRRGAVAGAVAVLLGLLTVAIASEHDVELGVASHPELGDHLVDGDGMALYLFDDDEGSGWSTCIGSCAENWPPLQTDGDVAVGNGLDEDLVDAIARPGGPDQVTYGDWPLYRFAGDEEAGDVGGHGADGRWHLVTPAGERLGSGGEGEGGDAVPIRWTEDQVERGNAAYDMHCAGCHLADLSGQFDFPALVGSNFMNYWGGRTVHELYEYARSSMPQGNPGSLSDEEYSDILAYIFHRNDVEHDDAELTPEASEMQLMTIPPRE